MGEELPEEVKPRAYCNATFTRKFLTIFAGPAVNIVLAFVIFAVDLLDRRPHPR